MKKWLKCLFFTVMLGCLGAAFIACDDSTPPQKESFQLRMVEYTDYAKYQEYYNINSAERYNYRNMETYNFYKGGANLQADGDTYFFKINDGLGNFPDMTTDGFTFMGVYSEPEGQGEMYIDRRGLIVKEITCEGSVLELYLHTIPIQYTACLHGGNGGTDAFVEYTYQTDNKALPTLHKENYDFLGWCAKEHDYEACDATCATTEITFGTWGVEDYYPVFRGVSNVVTLDEANGDLYEDDEHEIRYNETYSLPVPYAPTRMGFAGWWYDDGNGGYYLTDKTGQCLAPFTELKDITLTAVYKWTSVVWINTSVKNDANQTNITDALVDDEIQLTAPSITGYRCVGLSTANGQSLTNQSIHLYTVEAERVSLIWNYEPLTTMVQLQAQDSYVNGEMPESFTYDQTYALPKAYKKGYTFQGWMVDGEGGLLTDKEGNFTQAWTSLASYVSVKPSFVADTKAIAPIYDVATLQAVKEDASASYILLQDVDMTGEEWQPFDFSGVFDGNEKSISNLTASSASGDLGLFASLTGTVKNLTLKNISLESTSGAKVNIGGLCATFNGTAQNVKVYGAIAGDYCNVGGIVGLMSGGSITGSENHATITSITMEPSGTAGGLVGSASAGSIATSKNCGLVNGFARVGGALGYLSGAITLTEIENVGNVTGKNAYVGGVLGMVQTNGVCNEMFNVNNLKNMGEVKGGDNVGGVVGYWNSFLDWSSDDTYFVNLFKFTNVGVVSGKTQVGGCVGCITVSASNGWGRHPKMQFKATDFINTGNVTGETVVGGCIGYGSGQVDSKIIRSSSAAIIQAEHTVGGVAGSLSGVTIDSCENTNSTVLATSYYVSDSAYYVRLGGFVGLGYSVVNCLNEATISYEKSGGYVGGIAGYITLTVSNCQNRGKINAPSALFVGGIVGFVNNTYVYAMSELTNNGEIIGKECVGGIFGGLNVSFGINDSNTHEASFSKLENTGKITTSGGFSGGVIGKITAEGVAQYGHNASVKIVLSHIENSGDITTGSTASVGGIIGYAETDSVSSGLNDYICTGLLNGAEVTSSTAVGSATQFNTAS